VTRLEQTAAVVLAVLLVTAGVGSVAATGENVAFDAPRIGEGITQNALDAATAGSLPSDVVTHEGYPGWYVYVDEPDDRRTLATWTNESSARKILAWNNDSQRALVQAPRDVIGASVLDRLVFQSGLLHLPYVEGIDVEQRVSLPDTPEPMVADDYDSVAVGRLQDTTTGVAFSDEVNTSTMREARRAINATGTPEDPTEEPFYTTSTGGDIGVVNEGERPDGSGVTVAVLDDGTTYTADLFAGRVVAARNFVGPGAENATLANDYAAVESATGHGTWTASAAVGNAPNNSYDGVAPRANLAIGKVLGEGGSGSTQDIVEGVEWACDVVEADVVTMSLGSPMYSEAMAQEVRECARDGSIVTVAAGNSRQTVRYIASPADAHVGDRESDGIVTVTATTADPAAEAESAYFSQVGPDPAVDGSNGRSAGAMPTVGAPGMSVTAAVATAPGGRVGRSTLSGTSMSTPLVAGIAASVLSVNESLQGNPGAFEEWLGHAADPMPKAATTEVGAGMANLTATYRGNVSTDGSYLEAQAEAMEPAARARRDASRTASGGGGLLWQLLGADDREG
jgi:subtilisin family serine protease